MNKNSRYESLFRDQPVWKSIFSLAIPALLTIVVMIFYNLADMFFIAQLGDASKVASVSIISPVFGIIMALGTMIGVGGSTVISNAFGSGDLEKAKNVSSLCFFSAVVLGVIVTVVLQAVKHPLLKVLGTKPEMWSDSETYLGILAAGTIFMLIPNMMGMLIRSEGAVKEALIGNMAGTVTNLILDPIFILVFGWGVAGAAAATVIGNIVGTVYYIVYVSRHSTVTSLDPKRALAEPAAIFTVIALGIPNALSTILSGFASTFSNGLLSLHGTYAIAAAAAAGKSSMLISMVQMGICMGVQPLMAYCYGSKNKKRLQETIIKTGTLAGIVGLSTLVICFVFRSFIISLFLKDPAVASMGERYMMYVMAGAPFLGVVYISTNFMQAVERATGAIFTSLLRQGLLLIPLMYILHPLLAFEGIAAAHMIADIGAAVISAILFAVEYRRTVVRA